ncbi:class I SAM-dependent methyltransferase [Hylemonella gracilis]|uniref:Class I SAM-dependent methyltransferase n=1 Tax=Hylemonella gracilis TaxID=80880 RepID=A0A4P6UK46_9BURK|nr:class I SAM-dependent methyltransferase [Hylemonella gracilis]QBK03721.1 class I SAM-dependent methyltransferase [Hylemonella gracilis]
MANHAPGGFFGIGDGVNFRAGLQQCINSMEVQDGIYAGDNLFTINRNLSFLEDSALMAAHGKHVSNLAEHSVIWRVATILWGVRNGLRLEGDFVECACYKGTTVRIVCDAVGFAQIPDRKYYLYDLFDHDPTMPHHAMLEHSRRLYQQTQGRFSDCPNVTVTQGRVPEILAKVAPEKIAFMHLDLNNAEAEVGALEVLFDRLVPGGVLILDDYGWLAYRQQKLAEDPWFEARGYRVLELPTGQGLVIK